MFSLIVFLALGLGATQGDQRNLPAGTVPTTPVSTVTFTWSLSRANPPYYSVAITTMGSIAYKSFPNSDMVTGNPYVGEFTATKETRTEIFRLAEEANFFRGLPSHRGEYIQRLSTKSLTYDSGTIHNQTFYLHPVDRRIQRLTALFEDISSTINFRRLLERTLVQNPGGLSAELRNIGEQRKKGKLIEFQALTPVLEKIASDSAIGAKARSEAQSLLKE